MAKNQLASISPSRKKNNRISKKDEQVGKADVVIRTKKGQL
jgi:hypothetical protein